MLTQLMNAFERAVYGPDTFLAHARATRALLKFCVDHHHHPAAIADIRAVLAALERGERSNAVASFRRVHQGKDGFGDWLPPADQSADAAEYDWAVFEALFERWHRLMSALEKPTHLSR